MNIIDKAVKIGRTSLSEFEAKQLLAAYQIPVTREALVENEESLLKIAATLGYPLALKGCSADIAHKAFKDISTSMKQSKNTVLVQEMVQGKRELMAGLTRDAQFGPCVSSAPVSCSDSEEYSPKY